MVPEILEEAQKRKGRSTYSGSLGQGHNSSVMDKWSLPINGDGQPAMSRCVKTLGKFVEVSKDTIRRDGKLLVFFMGAVAKLIICASWSQLPKAPNHVLGKSKERLQRKLIFATFKGWPLCPLA